MISSPAIASGIVYFGSADGYIYAVDVETGKRRWRYKTHGGWMRSSPAVANGMIYFGSDDSYLYALHE